MDQISRQLTKHKWQEETTEKQTNSGKSYIFPPGFKELKHRSSNVFLSSICRNTSHETRKSNFSSPESKTE